MSHTYNSPELVLASLEGDLEKVKNLIADGADINSEDSHGMGPLLTFTPQVMKYLLEQGADPNIQKNENRTPVLTGIAYMNNAACVRLLLEAGADPNLPCPNTGETALHSSVSKPEQKAPQQDLVVKALIEFGADPNLRTVPGVKTKAFWRDVRTRGETPLHRAAAFANITTLQVLLKAGADVSIRDAYGDSAQSWASWHWRPREVIDLLSPDSSGLH